MIGAIEQAIIGRIKAASDNGVLGYSLRSVDSYSGEFDARIDQAIQKFPAVWVAFAGAERPTTRGKGAWDWPMRFAVIAAARNRRNERSRRRGDGGDPGSYQVTEDVAALLLGQTFNQGIGPFEPFTIRGIASDETARRKLSIYVLELRVMVQTTAQNLASDLSDFRTFHADWDLPPVDPAAGVPRAPGEADATDSVQLETE